MMTIANTEMAAAWDGEEGEHWTEFADRYDASSNAVWARFLGEGLIKPADRVLDVGCGTGQSTRDVARVASSGSVTGIDLSARMLDDARRRAAAEGITNVDFIQGDAQVHPFDPGTYDMAISRYGAMFFNDRTAALANIGRAVKSGGRLAFLAWRRLEENEWLNVLRDSLAAGRTLGAPPLGGPGPFGLADPDGAGAALAAAGFTDVGFEPVDDPVFWGADYEDAWAFVQHVGLVKGLTHDLDEAARAAAIAKLQGALRSYESSEGVTMPSGSWLITATKA